MRWTSLAEIEKGTVLALCGSGVDQPAARGSEPGIVEAVIRPRQRGSTLTHMNATGSGTPFAVLVVNEAALAKVDATACSASGLSTGSG